MLENLSPKAKSVAFSISSIAACTISALIPAPVKAVSTNDFISNANKNNVGVLNQENPDKTGPKGETSTTQLKFCIEISTNDKDAFYTATAKKGHGTVFVTIVRDRNGESEVVIKKDMVSDTQGPKKIGRAKIGDKYYIYVFDRSI